MKIRWSKKTTDKRCRMLDSMIKGINDMKRKQTIVMVDICKSEDKDIPNLTVVAFWGNRFGKAKHLYEKYSK